MTRLPQRILFLFIGTFSFLGSAAGFRCDTPHRQLRIKVYQHTHHTSGGTKAAAIMILSNPSAPKGMKTIATMKSEQGLLELLNGTFSGFMDLRFNSISKKPQNFIGPYPKSEVQRVSITPDFRYSEPVPNNTKLKALFELELKNGEIIKGTIDCRRYLKANSKASKTCSDQLDLEF